MKFVCGTCWNQAFLHACMCLYCIYNLLMTTECEYTKKAHCPNSRLQSLVCGVTYVLVTGTKWCYFLSLLARNLWWSKLQLKVPSLFVSYQRARCDNIYILISFFTPQLNLLLFASITRLWWVYCFCTIISLCLPASLFVFSNKNEKDTPHQNNN